MGVLWCKRGEAGEKRRGGSCLRADHGMEAETWRSAQHPGRPPDYIKGQIGGSVLHKFYQGCRPVR